MNVGLTSKERGRKNEPVREAERRREDRREAEKREREEPKKLVKEAVTIEKNSKADDERTERDAKRRRARQMMMRM